MFQPKTHSLYAQIGASGRKILCYQKKSISKFAEEQSNSGKGKGQPGSTLETNG